MIICHKASERCNKNGIAGKIVNMDTKQNNASDEFENELDDFFKERALFRTHTFSDSSKLNSGTERVCEANPHHDPTQMSGCCMTGCHDCPWGYSAARYPSR